MQDEIPDEAAQERSAGRYLDLIKRALLDELELARPGAGRAPDRTRIPNRPSQTPMDRHRLDQLEACLDAVRAERIGGDLVECGAGGGDGAIFMRAYLAAHEMTATTVWVADDYGPDPRHDTDDPAREPPTADLQGVRQSLGGFGLFDDRVRLLPGALADALWDAPIERVALLHLGPSLGSAAAAALDLLYDKLAPGACVIVDGCDAPERRADVEDFRSRRGIEDQLGRLGADRCFWRATEAAPVGATEPPSNPLARARIPRPARQHPDSKGTDLSVVVVFFDNRREAPRTLQSLARSYQEGVEELDYEVVAVENGSAAEEALGEDFVRSFGPEFRYVDVGDDATPSPTGALNRGIEEARGDSLALMIDGAYLLTPGVLRYGVAGLATYDPAVVLTQQWYLGPCREQDDAMRAGYDEAYEDRLLEEIGWPHDGYALFDIGHFLGERDWFDAMGESNCLFVSRTLLEQVGGFDDSFSIPGGGLANGELLGRLARTPGVSASTILGEACFHQLHGGTTTNNLDPLERRRRVRAAHEHHATVRRESGAGIISEFQYVGHLPPGTQRTRARRRVAPNLFKAAAEGDPDGLPDEPALVPDELKLAFTDALWRSLTWRETTWLGRPVAKAASDLIAYQELVARLRPDWVVETRAGEPSLAPFFASLLELIDHGRVLSIDPERSGDLEAGPRADSLAMDALDEGTLAQVRATVGEGSNTMVVLGSRAPASRTLAEFEAYAPLVPVGGYVVVEDTIVGGHPVWPSFGPGPGQAVTQILKRSDEFVRDASPERHGPSFNAGGYLRRVSG